MQIRIAKIYFLFFIEMLPVCIAGQDLSTFYRYEALNSDDGLSNSYVTKIVQDEKGIMWFATETGLDKYDGYNFMVYANLNTKHKENTGDNIETIFKDANGNIWIGTKTDGLYYMDVKRNKITQVNLNYNDTLKTITNRVLSITPKSENETYVGMWQSGLWCIDNNTLEIKSHTFTNSTVQCILNSGDTSYWCGIADELVHIDSAEQVVAVYPLPRSTALSIIEDSLNNTLWIGTWKGVFKFNKSTHKFSVPDNLTQLAQTSVPVLLKDNNHLWIGTWDKGLFRYQLNDDKLEPFYFTNACSQVEFTFPVIFDLFMDKYGTLWVSGKDGIVKIIKKQPFGMYCMDDYKSNMILNNMAVYKKDGHFLLGTNYGLIYLIDGKKKHIPMERIRRFMDGGNNQIYMASSGLYSFNTQQQSATKIIELNQVTDILLKTKDTLWIATKEHGVYVYKKTRTSYEFVKNYNAFGNIDYKLKSNRISRLIKDEQGVIWVATYKGLYFFDQNTDCFIDIETKTNKILSSAIINDILTLENKLYIATSNGLSVLHLDNYALDHIQSDLGISNNYINAIQLDSRGNIWASTNYGINRYSFFDYSVKNFNTSNGVFFNSFIESASFKDKEGFIYFNCSPGVVFFHPDSIKFNYSNPRVILANLKINHRNIMAGDTISKNTILKQEIEYTSELVLTHLDKVFSISTSTDDYLTQSNIYYKHRLLGFEKDWIFTVNSPEITYTNLDAGMYTLEIIASRDKDNWPDEKTILQIKVLPAPWKTGWSYIAYGIVCLLGISLLWRLLTRATVLRNKLRFERIEKQKEKELTESKLRFFTNISHEFRTPLTLINGPLEDALAHDNMDTKLRNKLHLVYQNSRRLMSLINQLLEFRKIETGNDKLKVAEGNIVVFTREVYLSFKELAISKKIRFEFNSSNDEIKVWFDRDKMEILISNLLSNAFKYTNEGGTISLSIKKSDKHCEIHVSDTGRGISKSYQKRVFDRFYQIRNQDTSNLIGSGIGLSLTKTIAELHSGQIKLNSTLGKGSVFMLQIPLGNKHFTAKDLIKDFKDSNHYQHYRLPEQIHYDIAPPAEKTTPGADIILVIDDNKEIRDYIHMLLDDEYHIIEAENGSLGFELALKEVPDLIISDVMMPVMDGIELCRRVKQKDETSHIPVILLTARTSNIFQISGLQTGADDYITKPFVPDILKARVANLLSSREKLKEYYSKRITLEASNIIVPDKEAEFLQKAICLVEKNIDNSEFSSKDLQQELGMSQPTLYRKLKALTEESPSSFIRSIRLKHAAEILKKGGYNVNDALYASGFSDVKYFRECFKKQFGCTPSLYIDQHRENNPN